MKILLHPEQSVDPGKLMEVPASLQENVSPWATVEFRQYDFGSILTQQFLWRQFQIYIYYFIIDKVQTLYVSCDMPTTALQATLQGKIPGTIKGGLDVLLEARTYSLVYLPAGFHQVNFDPGIIESIHIEMEANYIEVLTDAWEWQEELLTMIRNAHEKGFLFPRAGIDYLVQNIINRLRSCNRTASTGLNLEFQTCILSLLAAYVNSIDKKVCLEQFPAVAHGDVLLKIRESIKADPQIHYTISDFAGKYYISESALKDGFQVMFGVSFSGFVLQQCMEKARHYLTTSYDLIGDISARIGYTDNSNFSRAYKKYYGISPKEERKQREKS